MSKESKANNSGVKEEKNKQAMNRRKLLGSLAVVGGVSAMPSTWVKPVINSVVLPAHAQTSATDASSPISPAVGPVLSLSATSFDVSSVQPGLTLNLASTVISSDPLIASGGIIELTVGSASIPVVAVEIIFEDSNGVPQTSPGAGLIPNTSDQLQGFADSMGVVFGLDVSLSLDGNTLNLSLIL